MTLAFICPDSFKDYGFLKNELSKLGNITKIICATSNATRLIKAYVSEHENIEYGHEKRGGKLARMRRIVQDSEEIFLVEFTDYDPKKTKNSRTQEALKKARTTNKKLHFFEYDRYKKCVYSDKDELLDKIDHFCLPPEDIYAKRYSHPLSQASPELRNDQEVVMFALERYGFAFDFASRQMQKDMQFVLQALKRNAGIFPYVYEKLRKESEVMNAKGVVTDKVCKRNATYLFNQPTGKFHHSESRWSAIAQMAFIWLSKQKEGLTLFVSTIKDDRKNWLKKSGEEIHFTGWTVHNTFVEAYIKRIFDDDPVLNTTLKPDIVWMSKEYRQIVLIEVKTVGTTKKHNIQQMKQYEELVVELSNLGWQTKLYYLMPYGFEDKTGEFAEWHYLEKENIKIILWEELFSKMKDSDIAPYIDEHLEHYTLMPDWLKSTEENETR